MTNNSGTLYIGVTNDLLRRVHEHKTGTTPGFTSRYRMDRLVYFESSSDVRDAIEREKYLKGWLRKKKIELIRSLNPTWRDLSEGWYDEEPRLGRAVAKDQIPFGRAQDMLPSGQNDNSRRLASPADVESGELGSSLAKDQILPSGQNDNMRAPRLSGDSVSKEQQYV